MALVSLDLCVFFFEVLGQSFAQLRCYVKLIEELLKHRADPNCPDHAGVDGGGRST